MDVKLVAHTPEPEKVIADCARTCYMSEAKTPDADQRLIQKLRDLDHSSQFEHAVATFEITGVSRALTHQLVRHRLASYSQQSQRYVDEKGFGYVTPNSVKDNADALKVFEEFMCSADETYARLKELGVPKEDARFVLPNACESTIRVTMNFRELRHFIRLRGEKGAQWEIRELAALMLDEVRKVAPAVFEDIKLA